MMEEARMPDETVSPPFLFVDLPHRYVAGPLSQNQMSVPLDGMMERFGKSRYGCQTLMYRNMKMNLTVPGASPSVVVLYWPQEQE